MTKAEKAIFAQFKALVRGYSYLNSLCRAYFPDEVSWCESKIVLLAQCYADSVSERSVAFPASHFKSELFYFIHHLSRRDVGLDFDRIRSNFIIKDIEDVI